MTKPNVLFFKEIEALLGVNSTCSDSEVKSPLPKDNRWFG